MRRTKTELSSGTATPEPQFDHDETPLTQVAGHLEDSDEIEGEGPYVILEGISDKKLLLQRFPSNPAAKQSPLDDARHAQ